MKHVTGYILAVIFACATVMVAHAQAAETIWLAASATTYKTGETVIATVDAVSATPIQGFTFQIRYDPACLRPINAASPIPSMNGLSLPQTAGLVDASFASTTPQIANGVLAEVRFVTLGGCQTNLVLENAALAVRNQSGFAAPLANVAIGEKNVALNIDKAVGGSQPTQPVIGTPLPLNSEEVSATNNSRITIVLLVFLMLAVVVFGAFMLFRKGSSARSR